MVTVICQLHEAG